MEDRTYEATNWPECRKFLRDLKAHFSRYADFYNITERQIDLARKHLSRAVREQWDIRARELGRATWFDFCVCLANELAPTFGLADYVVYLRRIEDALPGRAEALARKGKK